MFTRAGRLYDNNQQHGAHGVLVVHAVSCLCCAAKAARELPRLLEAGAAAPKVESRVRRFAGVVTFPVVVKLQCGTSSSRGILVVHDRSR